MMLQEIADVLHKPSATAEELRNALGQISIDQLESAVDDLERERRQALLAGDDKTLTTIEKRLSTANRDVERGALLRDELARRLAEVEAQDAAEARRKARASADRRAAALAKKLPEVATELLAIVEKLADELACSDREINEVNQSRQEGEEGLAPADFRARGRVALPEQLVSSREVHLWTYPGTGQPANNQEKVGPDGLLDGGWGGFQRLVKRRFNEQRINPELRNESPYPSAEHLLQDIASAARSLQRGLADEQREVVVKLIPVDGCETADAA